MRNRIFTYLKVSPHKKLIICKRKSSNFIVKKCGRDFSGDAVVKNPPANAGDMGSSPGLGTSHMPQSN